MPKGAVRVKSDKLRTPFKNALAKPKGVKDSGMKYSYKDGMKYKDKSYKKDMSYKTGHTKGMNKGGSYK